MKAATSSEGFVPGRHLIEAYGAGGFRFAGMSHVGSILATPAGIRAFAPSAPGEISIDSLAPLFAELIEHPRSIEIFIAGTGEKMAPLAPLVLARLKQAGLRVEGMATGPAARVYNVLLDENRRVAAALIAAP
ncbi:MAG: Mth938-like domain-containing protein [Roseiarcus sp.]